MAPESQMPLWRVATEVAWTGHTPRIVVLQLTDPRAVPVALEGSAAEIWVALATRGEATTTRIASDVSARAETDAHTIEPAVLDFLERLQSLGLATYD